MKHTLTLGRVVSRSRSGPVFGAGPVMQYEIDGMPPGQKAFVANMEASQRPARWQILYVREGITGEWMGNHKTAADALKALQKELDD